MAITSRIAILGAALLMFLATNLEAAIPRTGNTVGTVISARGDERIRFAGTGTDEPLTPGQQLLAGDQIRTGPAGSAAVLFEDDTQIRVHRNSVFEVEQVRGDSGANQSRFRLLRGAAWSRAKQFLRNVSRVVQSRNEVVQMVTPVATIGIRGTDWHVQVGDGGETLVTVLTGEVALFNPLGEVSLTRGEQGQAVAGAAPTKRVLIDVRDRPLFALEFEPRWFENMRLSEAASMGELIDREAALKRIPENSRSSADTMELARAALDRNHLDEASGYLALERSLALGEGGMRPGQELLEGMRLARTGHHAAARSALESAAKGLEGRDRVMAEIGLAGLALLASDYNDAVARMEALDKHAPGIPDVAYYRALLPFFAGDDVLTRARVRDGEAAFSQDARFPALAAVFHLTQGEDAASRAAFERALAIDPRDALALMARAQYAHEIEPDAELAEQSLLASARSIDTSEAWNNLALVYQDLGRSDARSAFERALRIDPDSPLTLTNFATHLLLDDRIAEAKTILDRVKTLKPGYSQALLLDGLVALFEGDADDSVDKLTQAAVADPSLLQIYTGLAYAHYQAGNFEEADEAIEQARRTDPDDPTPLVVGAILALDQAEAGKAIRYSREALDKIRTVGSFAVEDIASASSGLSNVGFAYVNLGMEDWGEYYAQRAFSPYNAGDHFLLATQYGAARAQAGERAQGLLLDPSAVSFPNRYYEAVRTPRTDLSVGGSLGDQDSGEVGNLFGTLQGFARHPAAVTAWTLSAIRTDNSGFRTNTRERTESLKLGLGTRFNDLHDQLLWQLDFDRFSAGIPGDVSNPDPDDESRFRGVSGSLGWQHRFDYDNRLLVRLGTGSSSSQLLNGQPLGSGLDNLTYSLLLGLGEDATRDHAAEGLFDVTAIVGDEDNPILLTNSAKNRAACKKSPVLCATPISLALPDRIDRNPIERIHLRSRQADLQVRHLLSPNPDLELSYGAEWTPQDQNSSFDFLQPEQLQAEERRTGFLVSDVVRGTATSFEFTRAVSSTAKSEARLEGGQAYVQGRWNPGEALSAEGGLFLRHSNTDQEIRNSWDPRIGLNWEPGRGHWLRAAFQREMGVPTPLDGSLAPVATAGLAVTDLLPLGVGETVRDAQLRWDAEWRPGFYTVLQAEHQDIDAFDRFLPQTNASISVDGGRATQLALGSNLWFLERFGAFARYTRTWSSNTGGGDADGKDLPLLADDGASLGLTWIHPRQIRVSTAANYIGKRWGDTGNTLELDDYLTTSLSANWQPFHRYWSFTLTAENLFDESFDIAPGIPSPGVAVFLTAEYRLELGP